MTGAWKVPRQWDGAPAFIIAGGPSLQGQNFELLRGRNVIVINRSFEQVPWAQFCFGMDGDFFRKFQPWKHGFTGESVSTALVQGFPVKRLATSQAYGLSSSSDQIVCSRTSLQGAINLAVLLGAGSLVLIAADGQNTKAAAEAHRQRYPGKSHREARYGDWRKRLGSVAEVLKQRGIPVVNVSHDSAYADLWPTVPRIEDALTHLGGMDAGPDFALREAVLAAGRVLSFAELRGKHIVKIEATHLRALAKEAFK